MNLYEVELNMKTSDLNGAALDWAVARCEVGEECIGEIDDPHFYSTEWEQGGPIIEEHGIHLEWSESHLHWLAYSWDRFSNESHHCAL